jgi:hypothetical protein
MRTPLELKNIGLNGQVVSLSLDYNLSFISILDLAALSKGSNPKSPILSANPEFVFGRRKIPRSKRSRFRCGGIRLKQNSNLCDVKQKV